LSGQAGRRIGITRSGGEGIRRRVMAGLWVALLLAILTFLVIYPVLTLLAAARIKPPVVPWDTTKPPPSHFLSAAVRSVSPGPCS
jgi:hypothetical protein